MIYSLVVGVIIAVVAIIIFAAYSVHQRPKDIAHREAKIRHLTQQQKEQQASQDARLVYHYALYLIFYAIANHRNKGDEVTINLYNHFLIHGKNIFDPSERKITIRRLARKKDDPLPQTFFIINGSEVGSYLYPDGLLPRFINDAELACRRLQQ